MVDHLMNAILLVKDMGYVLELSISFIHFIKHVKGKTKK